MSERIYSSYIRKLLSNTISTSKLHKMKKKNPGWQQNILWPCTAILLYSMSLYEMDAVYIDGIENDMFHAFMLPFSWWDPISLLPITTLSTKRLLKKEFAKHLSYLARTYNAVAFCFDSLKCLTVGFQLSLPLDINSKRKISHDDTEPSTITDFPTFRSGYTLLRNQRRDASLLL